MQVRLIPLLAALVPFFAVHLTYLVAASTGTVDWCIPYIDSCTSISATGRKPPASYLFRAMMLPSAVFMAAYWWCSLVWLDSVRQQDGMPGGYLGPWMLALGVVACIGLVLYVTVLGESGDLWSRQRRIGTVLFFSFTYIAQLLLVAQLRQLQRSLPELQSLAQLMLAICSVLLLLGLLTVVLDAWNEQWYETVEDAFEWVLSLLLQLNFLLGYFLWRRSAWGLVVSSA
ncbi:MAG: hypothetical protein ABJK20_19070 [Halieaceae bacterium]